MPKNEKKILEKNQSIKNFILKKNLGSVRQSGFCVQYLRLLKKHLKKLSFVIHLFPLNSGGRF